MPEGQSARALSVLDFILFELMSVWKSTGINDREAALRLLNSRYMQLS